MTNFRSTIVATRHLALCMACMGCAHGLTPSPDGSAEFFAGEWSGLGEQGRYCYLTLQTDGWGWLLVDGGAGDWLGARLQWRNRQQALDVQKIVPLAASPERRIMPLTKFELRSGFNQSLTLTWYAATAGCHLQKLETTALHLQRARQAVQRLPAGEGTQ